MSATRAATLLLCSIFNQGVFVAIRAFETQAAHLDASAQRKSPVLLGRQLQSVPGVHICKLGTGTNLLEAHGGRHPSSVSQTVWAEQLEVTVKQQKQRKRPRVRRGAAGEASRQAKPPGSTVQQLADWARAPTL